MYVRLHTTSSAAAQFAVGTKRRRAAGELTGPVAAAMGRLTHLHVVRHTGSRRDGEASSSRQRASPPAQAAVMRNGGGSARAPARRLRRLKTTAAMAAR